MREIGIIISVDDNKIQLITLDGRIRNINRFDIIYIAYYPLRNIQVPKIIDFQNSTVISIKTIYKDEVVDLVTGWVIDYSEDHFSFLSTSGNQFVVDKEDIWDIEINPLNIASNSEFSKSRQYKFVHPYPFKDCKIGTNGIPSIENFIPKVYPQNLMSDPLMIKNELDRLKQGYDKLKNYEENKIFYPVPLIYSNDTFLGIWFNLGSRYGSSRNRKNSFLPVIRSELAEGPFGFQRLLITGVAPMKYSIHEEPQFQAYYRLKSSYVHFSIMADVSRFNIGQDKYKWSLNELELYDDRENEIFYISGGFDYGHWAIDISIWNSIYYAVRHNTLFHKDDIQFNKVGVFYNNRFFQIEFYMGSGNDTKPEPIPLKDGSTEYEQAYIDSYNAQLLTIPNFKTRFNVYRLNLKLLNFKPISTTYSLIYKSLDFIRDNALGKSHGGFKYLSETLTNVVYYTYPLNSDFNLSGYASLESVTRNYLKFDNYETSTKAYPKAGLSGSILF